MHIFRLLQQRATCTCGQIVDTLPLAQSTVSQHIAGYGSWKWRADASQPTAA